METRLTTILFFKKNNGMLKYTYFIKNYCKIFILINTLFYKKKLSCVRRIGFMWNCFYSLTSLFNTILLTIVYQFLLDES